MRYFLVGHKGSGKSTLGRKLASKLDLKFMDLDTYIEEMTGKNIPAFYAEVGEDGFRETERLALEKIIQQEEHVVIATGGGAPCFNKNMDKMNGSGVSIFLKVPDDILINRLKIVAKNRPIVKSTEEGALKKYLADMKYKRDVFYEQATLIVEGRDIRVRDLEFAVEEYQNNKAKDA